MLIHNLAHGFLFALSDCELRNLAWPHLQLCVSGEVLQTAGGLEGQSAAAHAHRRVRS